MLCECGSAPTPPTSGHDNSSPRWLQWPQWINIPNLALLNHDSIGAHSCLHRMRLSIPWHRVTLFGPLKINPTGEGNGFENDLLPISPRTHGTTPRPQTLIGRGHALRSGSDQSDQSKTTRVYNRSGGFGAGPGRSG